MKKNIFFLVVLANSFQIACSQTKELIIIEQVPAKYSVILKANSDKNKIEYIRFYLAYKIKNNTGKEIKIIPPTYIYNKNLSVVPIAGWTKVIRIFIDQNNKLEYAIGKGLDVLNNTEKEYILTVVHEPIKDLSIQSMFSSYLEKMKRYDKDTLHIGTISELKNERSPILQFLKGDSIIFSSSKKDLYIDPIPVQIK